jgi:hypothetical protein
MSVLIDGTAGITTPDLTDTSLTSGRVVYAGTGGNLTGSASLVFDGTSLGVGVTPASWATFKALEVGYAGMGLHGTGQNDLNITSNAYYNAGYKYGGTGRANLLELYNGEFYFKTAGSGTAGNAITFTDSLAVGLGKTLALEGATSQTGTGITFPATQSASSNANTLDDYEEGTWTTTFNSPLNLTGTPAISEATYTKVGRLVLLQAIVTGYSITSSNTRTGFTMTVPFNSISNSSPMQGSAYSTAGAAGGVVLDNTGGNANEIFINFSASLISVTGSTTFNLNVIYAAT